MLTLRLEPELERYLENQTTNKSEYVRELIWKDKQKNNDVNEIFEYNKCRTDVVYFANNYCYVKNSGSTTQIQLFDYQQGILERLVNGENLLIVKGRRLGITTTLAIYFLWKLLFHSDVSIGYKSVKDQSTSFINSVFDYMEISLPHWMRKPYFTNNKTLKHFQNNSLLKHIDNTRSEFDVLALDESSHFDNLEKSWKKLKQLVIDDGQLIITTTGILKGKGNYEQLKEFYFNESIENLRIDWKDHPLRDQNYKLKQVELLGGETRFLEENGALVEIPVDEG